MARPRRIDDPGSWHHVVNRGIAKRAMFEDPKDVRHFLAQLAREVHAGRLELHAWSILTSHYHLLVRSPRGELSTAMRNVQNRYSKAFNRRHHRDGSLVRARFFSRTVNDADERRQVVIYIDANAVRARLAAVTEEHEGGSARYYLRTRGPRWMSRYWIEGQVREWAQVRSYDPSSYVHWARDANRTLPAQAALEPAAPPRHGPHLVNDASSKDRRWMQFKARVAEGRRIGEPVCSPLSVSAVVREARAAGPLRVRLGRRWRDAWPLVETALHRGLCGESLDQIAVRLGCSRSACSDRLRRHRELCRIDPHYERRVRELADRVHRQEYGARHLPPE